MRWGFSSSRPEAAAAALAAAALMALAQLGATCESQDYTAPERLVLTDAPEFEAAVMELEQPFRGLNSIDYRIVNTGDGASRYGLFVAVSYEQETEEGLQTFESTTSRVTEALAPGEEASGRLFETELGLGEIVHVEFLCFDDDPDRTVRCSGFLDLTILIRQVECRVDSDCSAGEECDSSQGRCVTALEGDRACQAVSAPAGVLVPAFSAVLLLVLATRRRRR